jgi:hypothetical protein
MEEPHWPWFCTGPTAPLVRQSTDGGTGTDALACTVAVTGPCVDTQVRTPKHAGAFSTGAHVCTALAPPPPLAHAHPYAYAHITHTQVWARTRVDASSTRGVPGDELLGGQVGKLIERHTPRVPTGIVRVHPGDVGGEHRSALHAPALQHEHGSNTENDSGGWDRRARALGREGPKEEGGRGGDECVAPHLFRTGDKSKPAADTDARAAKCLAPIHPHDAATWQARLGGSGHTKYAASPTTPTSHAPPRRLTHSSSE